MVKLTRLKIDNFRNIDPVELRFSYGMNVLLGINGSGKTTFLELIAGLLRQDISAFRDEKFAIEYDLSVAHGRIGVRLENLLVRRDTPEEAPPRRGQRRESVDYTLRAHVRVDIPSLPMEYDIDANRISITTSSRARSSNQSSKSSSDAPPGFESRFLDAALNSIASTWDDDTNEALEAIHSLHSVSRFDESLEFFHSIVAEKGWIHAHTDDTKSPIRLVFDDDTLIGPSLMDALGSMADESWFAWRGSETISLSMTRLLFLAEVARLANFKHAKLELRVVGNTTHQSEWMELTTFSFGMLRFWFEKVDGTIIPEQKLSYGQKRLLSFLYYLDCNPHVIVADELAAGLHHAWITACVDAIGDRQAFLASQDPLLIDEIEISSVDDVERSFILCRCDMSSGKERLVWSNMSGYDAERFFEAYNVGLQHVSEILRTKRLW